MNTQKGMSNTLIIVIGTTLTILTGSGIYFAYNKLTSKNINTENMEHAQTPNKQNAQEYSVFGQKLEELGFESVSSNNTEQTNESNVAGTSTQTANLQTCVWSNSTGDSTIFYEDTPKFLIVENTPNVSETDPYATTVSYTFFDGANMYFWYDFKTEQTQMPEFLNPKKYTVAQAKNFGLDPNELRKLGSSSEEGFICNSGVSDLTLLQVPQNIQFVNTNTESLPLAE